MAKTTRVAAKREREASEVKGATGTAMACLVGAVGVTVVAGVLVSGEVWLVAPAALVALGLARVSDLRPGGFLWKLTRAWQGVEVVAFAAVPGLLMGLYIVGIIGAENVAAFVVAVLLAGLALGVGVGLASAGKDGELAWHEVKAPAGAEPARVATKDRERYVAAATAVGAAVVAVAIVGCFVGSDPWLVAPAMVLAMGYHHAVGLRYRSRWERAVAWVWVVSGCVWAFACQPVLGTVAAGLLVLALVTLQRGWRASEDRCWWWVRRAVFRWWPFAAVIGCVLATERSWLGDGVAALELAAAFGMADAFRMGAKVRMAPATA